MYKLKNTFNRVIALVLSVALVALSMAGCKNNTSSESEAEQSVAYKKGYWVGSVFVSRYTGVLFEMPQEWSRYSDADFQELAMNMNLGDNVTFDMLSMSPAGSSIMLYGEDLSKLENSDTITEKEYLDALAENLKGNTEYTYTLGQTSEVGLLDVEYLKLEVKISGEGVEKTQWYLVRKIDNNMAVFVFTGKDTEEIEGMASYFTEYTEEVNQEGFGEDATEENTDEDVMLKKGGWSEVDGVQVYQNESMNLKFTSNDEWTVMEDDELNSLSGNEGESENLTIADGYENASAFEFGVKTENGSTVVMIAEDLGLDDLTKTINERGYIQMIEQNLSQTDLQYEFGDAEEVKVGSRDFLKLPVTVADGEAQQWYFVDKVDVFMLTIIVTAKTDNADEMDAFMSAFAAMQEEEETSTSSSQEAQE